MFKEQTGFLLVFTINDYNVKMSTWVNVCRPKPQILKTDMIKCDNTVDAWHFVIPYIKDIKREQNHSFRFPNTQRNHFINLSYQSFQLSYNIAIHVLHFVSKLKKKLILTWNILTYYKKTCGKTDSDPKGRHLIWRL